MPSSADVLDEATMALIAEMDHMHRATQPQDIARCVQTSLGSKSSVASPLPCDHPRLTPRSTWRKTRSNPGLPPGLASTPKANLPRCSSSSWTKSSRFSPTPRWSLAMAATSRSPLSGFCPWAYKSGTYDPDDYHLFSYTCCTSTSGLPQNLTWKDCELRALETDRGYIPPAWYLAAPPSSTPTPDQAIILHNGDDDTKRWIKLLWPNRAKKIEPPSTLSQSGKPSSTTCTNPASTMHRPSCMKTTDQNISNSWNTRSSWSPQASGPWSPTSWQRLAPSSTIGRKPTHTWLLLVNPFHRAPVSSAKSASTTSRTSWTLSCQTCANTTFAGTPNAASSTEPLTGPTQPPRRNKGLTYVPGASPSTVHGQRSQQEVLPCCTMPGPQSEPCYTPRPRWLVTEVDKLHRYRRFMVLPTTNDAELLNECKVTDDAIAAKLSQSDDPHADLLQYINTVLAQAQPLPYFGQYRVEPEHIAEVKRRNAKGKKQPITWSHLPTATDPHTKQKIHPVTTKILEAENVHQLIGLIFCKI